MSNKKKVENLKIVKISAIEKKHVYIELKLNQENSEIFPGQFVQVLVPDNPKVFLRRPFSVHDYDSKNKILSLLIKIVGEGTLTLSKMKLGEYLNIIYPLGNGFTMPKKDGILLVGGGCGAAPLLYLSRNLSDKGYSPDILLGASTKNEILYPEKYSKFGNISFITEDESLGSKGLVTAHDFFKKKLSYYSKIYACGPEPMMKAVGSLAIKNNVECEVSLENLMACGIGACLCCVVNTDEGNVCTCTEGPVFAVTKLQNWLEE